VQVFTEVTDGFVATLRPTETLEMLLIASPINQYVSIFSHSAAYRLNCRPSGGRLSIC
jgi:hypothetical protein